MRKMLLAVGLLFAVSGAAMANGNHNNGGSFGGVLGGAVVAGQFGSAGGSNAVSGFGGVAEAYSNGNAGLSLQNGSFGGFRAEQAGAQTTGNALASGWSEGFVSGFGAAGVVGGFGQFNGFSGW